jgi:hypothetical protein
LVEYEEMFVREESTEWMEGVAAADIPGTFLLHFDVLKVISVTLKPKNQVLH